MRRKWIKPSRAQRRAMEKDWDIKKSGRQWVKLRKFIQWASRDADPKKYRRGQNV